MRNQLKPQTWRSTQEFRTGMYYISCQYLKAKSELTKLVSENYPHKISYWTNDIMTFNEKRKSVKYKWVSLKMQLFQVCLLTNEGPWYHSGIEITMYKRPFVFLPPNISVFVRQPSLFGNGEMAHEQI